MKKNQKTLHFRAFPCTAANQSRPANHKMTNTARAHLVTLSLSFKIGNRQSATASHLPLPPAVLGKNGKLWGTYLASFDPNPVATRIQPTYHHSVKFHRRNALK